MNEAAFLGLYVVYFMCFFIAGASLAFREYRKAAFFIAAGTVAMILWFMVSPGGL